MAKNVHTAVLPDGTVATRKSANRVYTHCVAVRRCYHHALMSAKQLDYVDRKNFAFYRANLSPATRRFPMTPEQVEADRKKIEGCETAGDYQKKMLAERVARVEEAKAEGVYDQWGVAGWNGRPDLAQKLHFSEAAQPHNAEVVTLQVEMIRK